LNVIQSDLTTQNDTLRELDQNWRDSLATYQDRLSSVEITLAGSGSRPATFLTEAFSPSTVQPESAPADADAVLDSLQARTLENLRESLSAQAGMLEEFQETTHQQLTVLSATLDAQQQDLHDAINQIADLQQDVRQLQQPIPAQTIDPQRLERAEQYAQEIRQDVATRLDEQEKRWTELAATVETIRADSKAAQETVVTMASNVVKWIHKIQNLLAATENTQSERLQEIEQKLIHLQSAFETLENQRKPRKWFSMPASLTAIMLIVGASGLAILVQVIWTIH
jgi:DNA repair exonuclease SbcCD ATPase subunit